MNPTTHKAAKSMEERRLPDWKLAYRIHEVCAATGLGKTTIFKRISEGKLRAKRDGRITIILRSELQRYLDNL